MNILWGVHIMFHSLIYVTRMGLSSGPIEHCKLHQLSLIFLSSFLPWIAIPRLPNKLTLSSKIIHNPTQWHEFPSIVESCQFKSQLSKARRTPKQMPISPFSRLHFVCFWGLWPHPRLSSMSWGIAPRGGPSCPPQEIQWDYGTTNISEYGWNLLSMWRVTKPLSPTDPQSLMSVFYNHYQLFVLELYS